MLISFPSSPGCEGPFTFQGQGIWVESLVETIGLYSVHSMTCNRGVLCKSELKPGEATHGGWALPGKCIQDSEAFPVERPIFSSISKGFYLFPSGEIRGVMLLRLVLSGDL